VLGGLSKSQRSITETGKKFKGRDRVYGRKIKKFSVFTNVTDEKPVKPWMSTENTEGTEKGHKTIQSPVFTEWAL
jgi:hypothetical protein